MKPLFTKNRRGQYAFPEDREKFGTEFLDNIGDRINETAFGRFRQKGLQKQADLKRKVYESSSPLIQKVIDVRNTPNKIEQQILTGISDATQIDERISTPLTYAAISGGVRGVSKIKPKNLGITQTIEPYTPPKGLGKTPRQLINITDDIIDAPRPRVRDIVRVAKKNKISYQQAKEFLDLELTGKRPTGTVNPGSSRMLKKGEGKYDPGKDEVYIPPEERIGTQKGDPLQSINPQFGPQRKKPKIYKYKQHPLSPEYKFQALFDAQDKPSSYDLDKNSPTYGQRLPTFGETPIEKGARQFREEAPRQKLEYFEQLRRESAPNVTPEIRAALTGSLTDIPAYKNIVGSSDVYDYKVMRQFIEGGSIAANLGIGKAVTGRDFLERFQTPVTLGGASRGVDFGQYRNLNVPKLKQAFGPALEALGLPKNAAQIHHIAALHAVSGIYHGLGYNSQIYRQVNKLILDELPNFKKGMGSMSENLMPIIAGSVDSPHVLTHRFYSNVIGKEGGKFFTDAVLDRMAVDKKYRFKKATELGKIIARAEEIAAQAQDIYLQLYGQGTTVPFDKVMDTMFKLNDEGLLPDNIMDRNYQVKTLGVLVKNINFALEVQQLKPSMDVMVLLAGKNRELELLRDVTQSGGTASDAYSALKKLYGKTLGKGLKQLTMFEDLLDVREFLSKHRILSQQKRDNARVRRNQAKYKKNE